MTYWDDDPIAPARGLCIGLVLGAAFWLTVAAIIAWRVAG